MTSYFVPTVPSGTARTAVLLAALVAAADGCSGARPRVTTSSGLTYTVIERGSGPVARKGQHVLIHETTTLADGTLIYTTRIKDQPLKFLLGGGQVVEGMDEGVTGMKVGKRRKLIVPPNLARRSTYPDNISPDDTLYYDIELIEIVPP